MSVTRNTFDCVTNPTIPNYVPTAAAAGTFGFSTLISMLDCGSTSFYANSLMTIAFTALAANQYGWAKSAALASNLAGQAKTYAMGLFKPSAEDSKQNEMEEEYKQSSRHAARK